jgi:hypothetical protein
MACLRQLEGKLAIGFILLVILSGCGGLPQKDRVPTAQGSCLGSVFLRQGQLTKLHLRNVVSIQHPYKSFIIREAVLSPDLEVVGILAQSGSATKPQSQVLFYECKKSRWHQGFEAKEGVGFSKLVWHPGSMLIAFLQHELKNERHQGKDKYTFSETLTTLSFPSFEVRAVLSINSESMSGKGIPSDRIRRKLDRLLNFQFHPIQSLMVLETRPRNYKNKRVFRVADLAQSAAEFPTDFKRWFETPSRSETKLFLTDGGGLRIQKKGEGWKYEMAPFGQNKFKSIQVSDFVSGVGSQPLIFRDNTLVSKVRTTNRIYLVSLSIEAQPTQKEDIASGRLIASELSSLETYFVYEGTEMTLGDFDVFMNRIIYSCRSKKSQLNKVCIGRLSDKPVMVAPVFASDENASIYPVMTYWPR